MKKKYPLTTKILTNLVISTAIGTSLFITIMSITNSFIQVLWSDATIILGLFVVIPIYITVFSIVTWAIMLHNK